MNNLPAIATCTTCPTKGACCSNFILKMSGGRIIRALDEFNMWEYLRDKGQPFVIEEDRGDHFSVSCPELRLDGLCGIYETRPKVCRNFQVGENALCYYGKE